MQTSTPQRNTEAQRLNISDPVAGKLGEIVERFFTLQNAAILWDRVFTETDRAKLGSNFDLAYDTHGLHGMWIQLHGGSRPQAIFKIAKRLGLLAPADEVWLARELGLADASPRSDRPLWNSARGELWYQGVLARKVRKMKTVSTVETILAAFQTAGWPDAINSPFGVHQTEMHDIIKSINRNLEGIRFHVRGDEIAWTESHSLDASAQPLRIT